MKQFRLNYDSAAPLGFDSPYSLQPGRNPFSIDDRVTAWQSGAYTQLTHDLTSALNVTVGGRFDRYQYIDASRVSPRLAATLALTPRLSLKASTGIYYQQPAFQFLTVFPENRLLKPFRADHYVGGASYTLAAGLLLSIEGYRKNYRDYPVSTDYPSLSLANLGDSFNAANTLEQLGVFPLVASSEAHDDRILWMEVPWHSGVAARGTSDLSGAVTAVSVRRGRLHDHPHVRHSRDRRFRARWRSCESHHLFARRYAPSRHEQLRRSWRVRH